MEIDVPFKGRRMSICQKCGTRTMTKDGYCDRCRALGFSPGRARQYDDINMNEEDRAKAKELERLQEAKRRELETPPTDEELAEVLKKRTRIYDRKKEKKANPLPESVDARIKG